MTITVLAVAFLLLILFVAVVGHKVIMQRDSASKDIDAQKCSICQKMFDKSILVERQIGDYKLMYFCRECVIKLSVNVGMKN